MQKGTVSSKRILYISRCDDCCFFNNQYFGYEEKCVELDIKIQQNSNTSNHDIPDNCPLPTLNQLKIK